MEGTTTSTNDRDDDKTADKENDNGDENYYGSCNDEDDDEENDDTNNALLSRYRKITNVFSSERTHLKFITSSTAAIRFSMASDHREYSAEKLWKRT